jgi:hypothetical protein
MFTHNTLKVYCGTEEWFCCQFALIAQFQDSLHGKVMCSKMFFAQSYRNKNSSFAALIENPANFSAVSCNLILVLLLLIFFSYNVWLLSVLFSWFYNLFFSVMLKVSTLVLWSWMQNSGISFCNEREMSCKKTAVLSRFHNNSLLCFLFLFAQVCKHA